MRKIAVNLFILFHVVAISLWSLPLPNWVVGGFRDAIRPYMLWSGLFQSWNMFAPSPMALNGYVDAEVIFADGQTKSWAFPRMEQIGLFERTYRERYRKYVNEYLRFDKYSALWPDAARYIARANYRPSNPPIAVILYRYWSEIGPPRPDGAFAPGPWNRYRFFLYAVKPGDLP
ncbi:MAG TPA: hypothetical protein VFA04_06360 [Bryobacteraceae bacterium]|nr:hypothetical protein [Bryobacteraceae bacterium]